MSAAEEIQEKAMALTEGERARLATLLLESLSPVLHDDDGGIAEALKREEEMDRDSTLGIIHEDFVKYFKG